MKILEVNETSRSKHERVLNLPAMTEEQARGICVCINQHFIGDQNRVWRVVADDYQLTDPGAVGPSAEDWREIEKLLARLTNRVEALEKLVLNPPEPKRNTTLGY